MHRATPPAVHHIILELKTYLQKSESADKETARVRPNHDEDDPERHHGEVDVRHDHLSKKAVFVVHVVRDHLHIMVAVVAVVLRQQKLEV